MRSFLFHKSAESGSAASGRGHKAKKRKPNVRKKAQIISGFRGADVSSVERKSDLFDGITFCPSVFRRRGFELTRGEAVVIEGLQDDTDDGSKRALEVVIFEHGGEYVQATPISENRKVIARSADCELAPSRSDFGPGPADTIGAISRASPPHHQERERHRAPPVGRRLRGEGPSLARVQEVRPALFRTTLA